MLDVSIIVTLLVAGLVVMRHEFWERTAKLYNPSLHSSAAKLLRNRVFDNPERSHTLLYAWLDGTARAADRGQGVEIFT